jgi:hypothetical protein
MTLGPILDAHSRFIQATSPIEPDNQLPQKKKRNEQIHNQDKPSRPGSCIISLSYSAINNYTAIHSTITRLRFFGYFFFVNQPNSLFSSSAIYCCFPTHNAFLFLFLSISLFVEHYPLLSHLPPRIIRSPTHISALTAINNTLPFDPPFPQLSLYSRTLYPLTYHFIIALVR